MKYKKNKTYTDKAMIGYIRHGDVVAIEPSWNLGAPEHMGKLLLEKYPTQEDAKKLVDSAIALPKFRKEDYWYVDGFGVKPSGELQRAHRSSLPLDERRVAVFRLWH